MTLANRVYRDYIEYISVTYGLYKDYRVNRDFLEYMGLYTVYIGVIG